MAEKEPTVRVVVKTAPLHFASGVKGRGTVSLIEESPVSVLGNAAATGRHFAKRFFLLFEGFRIFPGTHHSSDDPLYCYVMRDPVDAAQVRRDWAIVDGSLQSANAAIRALKDTSDSEIVLFDQVRPFHRQWLLALICHLEPPRCARATYARGGLLGRSPRGGGPRGEDSHEGKTDGKQP